MKSYVSTTLINNLPLCSNMGIELKFTPEQIAKFKAFEDSEIDQFLKKYFQYKETKIWLPEMTKDQFPSVRAETKGGIKDGIEDFLKSEKMEGLSLYVVDLGNFYFDISIKKKIKERLVKFKFSLKDLNDYSDYVCNSYCTLFITNYSIHLFKEKFKQE